MTFGLHHSALVAEYQSLMDEEVTLWRVISRQLSGPDADTDAGTPANADHVRWAAVRERRAVLDRAIDSLARPRASAWADRIGEAA